MSLTLACVWVKIDNKDHKRQYGPEYVENLVSMVKRNLDREFKVVCITNQPQRLPDGIRAVRIKPRRFNYGGEPLRGWWSKVQLFNPKLDFGSDRVLYLDLDVLIMNRLDPIVDFAAPFAITPDSAPDFMGSETRKVVKRYNSSIMVWDKRARPVRLFTTWTPEVANRLWSDQDWIGEQYPKAAMFPKDWMVRLSDAETPNPKAIVVACIKPKNHEAVNMPGKEWVRDVWYGRPSSPE